MPGRFADQLQFVDGDGQFYQVGNRAFPDIRCGRLRMVMFAVIVGVAATGSVLEYGMPRVAPDPVQGSLDKGKAAGDTVQCRVIFPPPSYCLVKIEFALTLSGCNVT